MYRFEHDWFNPNADNIRKLAVGNEEAPMKILEIGAFEGRSTVFIADHFKNSIITTIDTWEGSPEHEGNSDIDFKRTKENFDYNISLHADRITAIKGKSFDVLMDLYKAGKKFDFVYVDGAHDAISVNSDLVISFAMLNLGGLIYCDDYYWGFNENRKEQYYKNFVFDTPKLGIDSFVNVYANKLQPITPLTNGAAVFMKVKE